MKPIVGIAVSCDNQSDTTQKSGRYSIGDISTGPQTLTASGDNYRTYTAIVMISAGQETTHDIFLEYSESGK